MKKLAFAIVMALSFQAHAGLGVAGMLSYQMDTWKGSGTGLDSVKAKSGTTRVGVMLWLPIFPTLTIRTGYILETQEAEYTYTNTTKGELKASNHLIPLNLQFDLPFAGLYAFGGVLLATCDSVSPSAGNKCYNDDQRANLGVGYEFVSLGPVQLNGEAEYVRGMKNLSDNSAYDIKLENALALNFLVRVGF